jgi:hypothetical protein
MTFEIVQRSKTLRRVIAHSAAPQPISAVNVSMLGISRGDD